MHHRHRYPLVPILLIAAGACGIPEELEDGPTQNEPVVEEQGLGECPLTKILQVQTSTDDGNVGANVIDGSYATRWSAYGHGVQLTADLGAVQQVCGTSLAWYRGHLRRSTFKIEVSADGSNFDVVLSRTSSGNTAQLEYHSFPVVQARYVRVTGYGNTENAWTSVTELRVAANPSGSQTPSSPGSKTAPVFDGSGDYVEIPDSDAFSQPTRGALTVEAWIRPDSLSMPKRESSGYVHWMGKGHSGQHEWVARMYQQGNAEGRANRISFYSFNLTGGLGAGSYFQDAVAVGKWIHVVGVFDRTRTWLYKDGKLRDSDLLSGYDITPRNGTAPLRIGTRDLNSFFQGSIARVAIYGGRLSDARIAAHHAAAANGNYDATVLSEPSLMSYYRLDETSGTVAHDAKGSRNGTYHGGVKLGGAQWLP